MWSLGNGWERLKTIESHKQIFSLTRQGLFNEKKVSSGNRAYCRGNKKILPRNLGTAHNQPVFGGSIKMQGIT